MKPKIKSGALVTVRPLMENDTPAVGDIVLCKVRGGQYLHLIKAIQGARFQIGNNRGGINGWITRRSLYGVCVDVQP